MNKYRIIFAGTPAFAVPSLETLVNNPEIEVVGVITQPDKPAGRGKQLIESPVKLVAKKYGISIFTPNKVKDNQELFDHLKELNADALVVVAYGRILPQAVLDIPKHGIVNVHASLLPKYRGASPIAGAILAGDKTTGVTLMKMALSMDTGPIISVSKPLEITKDDTTGSLTEKLSKIGAELLGRDLIKYLNGEITPTPQNESGATYVSLIEKNASEIDWQELAETIARKVRAYSPWPGTILRFQDKVIKIISAEVTNETSGEIGTIWKTDDNYPAVTCSKNSLKLITVQPAGKKPMSGQSLIHGHTNLIGSQLA